MIKITDSERQVLGLLWESEEALTATEIIKLCEGRTWKPSYIHILIKSLLKKEMIQIVGFKKTSKNYARTFAPAVTRDEWLAQIIKQEKGDDCKMLKGLLCILLEEAFNLEETEELLEKVRKRKEELKSQAS